MPDSAPAVLDPVQLRRIEALHKGFFYQHVHGVGVLLSLVELGASELIVESDEDLEIVWADRRRYIQVKTRADVLRLGDIEGALRRFDALRVEHLEGRRAGAAEFLIVSNVAPGPGLLEAYREADWPGDVRLCWPDAPGEAIPPPWRDLDEGLAWCEAAAARVPYAQIAARSLVFKLAGFVQYAATGALGHRFGAGELPALFEQIVLQLQDFPDPPEVYREQIDEPSLGAEAAVRLVLGFSGAGKTAWASSHALHEALQAVYFDTGDTPSAALATALARELAARFPDSDRGLLIGSGLELLRAAAQRLRGAALDVTAVLDNVHRVDPEVLADVAKALTGVKLVLLGQPWPGAARLELALGLRASTLGGWSLDAIAQEFAARGAPALPATVAKVRDFTAGAPLYVQGAASLSAERFGGDPAAMVAALETRAHDVETAQEVLLSDVFEAQSPTARSLAAALGLAQLPLSADEAVQLARAIGAVAQAADLRALTRHGVVQPSRGGEVRLHDAFRLLAGAEFDRLDAAAQGAARRQLVELLFASLRGQATLQRLLRWLALLPQIGETSQLTDAATEEFFQEIGAPEELRAAIEEIAAHDASPSERFWAMDALAFWALQAGDHDTFARWTAAQDALAAQGGLGRRETFALHIKAMVRAGQASDRRDVERRMAAARALARNDHERDTLRYNHAVAVYYTRAYEEAGRSAFELAQEWAGRLGIDLETLDDQASWAARGRDDPDRQGLLKRLADALCLVAMSAKFLGVQMPARRRQSMLLYAAAGAMHSALKFGQDVVEDMLGRDDTAGARRLMEQHFLPTLQRYGFEDLAIQVRAQYAAVLAFDGAGPASLAELERLSAYDMTPAGAQDFAGQSQLVRELQAAGWPKPRAWMRRRV